MFNRFTAIFLFRDLIYVPQLGTVSGVSQLLELLKNKNIKQVKLFFAADLTYFHFFTNQEKESPLVSLQAEIPEKVGDVDWYLQDQQALVFASGIYRQLNQVLSANNINFSSPVSLPLALCEQVKKENKLKLLIAQLENKLEWVLFKKERIFLAQSLNLDASQINSLLTEIVEVAKNEAQEQIQQVIFLGDSFPLVLQNYQSLLQIKLLKLNWGQLVNSSNRYQLQKVKI